MGGVGILLEELCGKVVEVRRKRKRVMAMVLVFEEEIMRVISAYRQQAVKPDCDEDPFYN